MIYLISVAAFAATMLGGWFALRLRDKLHLILGFSAGAVVGVAFFDLLPEALELAEAHGPTLITALVALGFVIYLLLDRTVLMHGHDDDEHEHHHRRGMFGAGSLSLHSFLDGVGIGLAFQVSAAVGAVVAVAVLVHDFSDGINTVSMVLRHGGERARALRWLVIDALAPVVGVIVTMFFTLSADTLGLVLALFAGFFIYIGASDLIPESHHAHPVRWTTFATVLGVAAMYVVIRLTA